jgi:hypothetical protein
LIYAPGRTLFCTKKVPPPRAILFHLTFHKVIDQPINLIEGVFLPIFQKDRQKITPVSVTPEGQHPFFGEYHRGRDGRFLCGGGFLSGSHSITLSLAPQ